MLLENRVVIVSGVGPGLGRAMALEAASEGAAVVCVARTTSFVEEVVSEIAAAGGRAMAAPGDITSCEDCLRVVSVTEERWGRLDGLINSAFTAGPICSFEHVDLDDWRRAFEVNVFGTLSMIKAALPLLRRDGGGAVVNVNTTSAIGPMSNQGGYGGSKAALEFLTRQLAVELGPSGVRLNTVYCGPMLGPNLEMAMQAWVTRWGQTYDEVRARVEGRIASGRIPEDDDSARAIVMMLSGKASVINGARIEATGGIWLEHQF